MTKVFIDGSEGTTGLKIAKRLENRADVTILTIPDALRKDPGAVRARIADSDVTFLCLPDAAAREAAAMAGPEIRLIDASTAHRTDPGWNYGFAELSPAHRANIRTSRRVAVPGCHASGFISLIYPLIRAGVLDPDAFLSCTSLTGYSGGGKKMIAAYENPERPVSYDSPRMYGLSQTHKHLPEMQAVCGLTRTPVFMPIVSDFYAGMAVSVGLDASMLHGIGGMQALYALYAAQYRDAALISVRTPEESIGDGFLAANPLAGRDDMEIFITGNDQRMVVTSRFDNLGKGASGAALQCFNLMTGCPEDTGLILK